MAIAFYNSALAYNASSSPVDSSTSFDVGTGSDRLLVVYCYAQSDITFEGLTYNGTALTKLGSTASGYTYDGEVEVWYLVNPASGSNTLAWDITDAGTYEATQIYALAFSGVDQTTAIPQSDFDHASSTGVTSSVTTTAANGFLYAGTGAHNGIKTTGSVDSNFTEDFNNDGGFALSFLSGYRTAPTATSYNYTPSFTSTAHIQALIAIAEAAAGGVTGTGALADATSTVAGAGTVGRVGTGDLDAQASTIAGTGAVSGAVTGTGALDAQTSTIAGTGVVGRVGTGVLDAQTSVIAGTGVVGRVGTGDLDAQVSTVAGTGTVTGAGTITGTGAIDSASSAIAGTGVTGRTGTGDLDAQVSAVSGTGVVGRSGTGAVQCGVATINGVGIVTGAITGTGALAAQAAAIAGTGTIYTPVAITGTGALVCGASSISGSETPAIWTEIPAVTTTWTEI